MNEGREFSLAVVLSLKTSVLVCAFKAMHEAAEYLTGGPIWTHEFGRRELWEIMSRDIVRQHPILADANAEHVTAENWQAWFAEQLLRYPASFTLEPIPDYGRTKGPVETLAEMVGDKPIVVVGP